MSIHLSAPIKIVRISKSSRDPALDPSMDLVAYGKSRDESLVKTLPDRTPVWFQVKHMSAVFYLDVMTSMRDGARVAVAFKACCHEIRLPNGEVLTPTGFENDVLDTKMANNEWVDLVRGKFGLAAIQEIANVALERAVLSDEDRAGFTLPAGVATPS